MREGKQHLPVLLRLLLGGACSYWRWTGFNPFSGMNSAASVAATSEAATPLTPIMEVSQSARRENYRCDETGALLNLESGSKPQFGFSLCRWYGLADDPPQFGCNAVQHRALFLHPL